MHVFGPLVAATLMMAGAAANSAQAPLHCKVSGHGGCDPEGACVGAGTHDDVIHLIVDRQAQTIELNAIKGTILPEEPRRPGVQPVAWRWRLIGLDTIRYTEVDRQLYVTLASHETELEFRCR